MLDQLKKAVCRANLDLVAEGLVIQTWGNVSGIDRERGLVVIKPSGVPYTGMKPRHMVVVALATGGVRPTGYQARSSGFSTRQTRASSARVAGGADASAGCSPRFRRGRPRRTTLGATTSVGTGSGGAITR